MITMTRTTTPVPAQAQPISDRQRAVLAYYTREVLDVPVSAPLAGLKLGQFRRARGQLVRLGRLEQTPEGRYRPCALPREYVNGLPADLPIGSS